MVSTVVMSTTGDVEYNPDVEEKRSAEDSGDRFQVHEVDKSGEPLGDASLTETRDKMEAVDENNEPAGDSGYGSPGKSMLSRRENANGSPVISRGIHVTNDLQDTQFLNTEKYWAEFEQSEIYQEMKMISDEGIDLAASRATDGTVERPAPVAIRSPPRKGARRETPSQVDDANFIPPARSNITISGGKGSVDVEDSIFEYFKVPSDEFASSGQDEAETNDNYDESQVLRECTFSDMAFHFSSVSQKANVQFENDIEPRVYWIREDLGTLGFLNLGDRVRRVLLRGLKRPTRLQVIDHRVYWIEEGDEWQYNGRVSFFDTKTEKVHTLLSNLSEPRGLHVTHDHHIFFMETLRDFVPAPVSERSTSLNANGIEAQYSRVSEEPSMVDTGRSNFSLQESLASSRISKQSMWGTGPPTKDDRWARVWVAKMLHKTYVNASVVGANVHLSGFQRAICKLPSKRDLWERISSFAADVDGLDMVTKGDPYAEPCDLTVITSRKYADPRIVFGLDLYEVRHMQLNKKQLVKLQKMKEDRGETFDVSPVEERVQVGGAIMFADISNLDLEKGSKAEDDSQTLTKPFIVCTLPSAAHKVYSAPGAQERPSSALSSSRHGLVADDEVSIFISCRFNAPSIHPIPSIDDALPIPGFGLAMLTIPDRFEISMQELESYLDPLTSRGIACSVLFGHPNLCANRQAMNQAIAISPVDANGLFTLCHRSIDRKKTFPTGWIPKKTGAISLRSFSLYPPEEMRRRREDAEREETINQTLAVPMSDDESLDGQEAQGQDLLALESTTNIAFSAIGGEAGEGGQAMNVRVVLRERPLWDSEVEQGAKDVVVCTRKDVTVIPIADGQRKQKFSFERVYNRHATQMDVFEETVRPSVLASLDGYNVTVFAYGQTGTGKTYTMEGEMEDQSEISGIIPRSVYTLFEILMSTVKMGDWDISVSHLEIYQEELTDLLAPDELRNTLSARLASENITTSKALVTAAAKRGVAMKLDTRGTKRKALIDQSSRMAIIDDAAIFEARALQIQKEQSRKLRIRRDPVKGMEVMNLTELPVKSPDEIFEILEHSIVKRATAATLCNKQSSRSHAIFSINVLIRERDAEGELSGVQRSGRLNLVDLSGSENVGRSGSSGVRFREASNINQGLLALGRVIKARTEGAEHVPYRDSKLTQLLQESLGGNCVTTLILTISPNSFEMAETLSTLNYAHKAKVIENKPTKNIKVTDTPGGGGGAKGSGLPGQDDVVIPLLGEVDVHVASKVPWAGRVPIRAPGSVRSRRLTIKKRNERLFHAPSADWVENSVLEPKFSTFKHSPQESAIANFGYSPFKAPPASPTLSSREEMMASLPRSERFALSTQASSTLRKIYDSFPEDDIAMLGKMLNKVRGKGPKLGLPAFDDEPTGSVVAARRNNSSGGIALDFNSFQALFGAASKVDPVNALKTLNELGYGRNFSSLDETALLPPIEKGKGTKSTDQISSVRRKPKGTRKRAGNARAKRPAKMTTQSGIGPSPASELWAWLLKGPSKKKERINEANNESRVSLGGSMTGKRLGKSHSRPSTASRSRPSSVQKILTRPSTAK